MKLEEDMWMTIDDLKAKKLGYTSFGLKCDIVL